MTGAVRFARLGGLAALLALVACAKISEPQPPHVAVPKPAADLTLRQVGDEIRLVVSMPAQNTDGSRALTLGEVEVFRFAGDAAQSNALPEDAFLAGAQRIQAIPAASLGRYLKNGMLEFADSFRADPDSFYGRGLRYAIRFINKNNQTAGLSNQVFVAPLAIPAAPGGVSAQVGRDRILLSWQPPERNAEGSAPPRIAGYNVYRTEDPKSAPAAPLNPEPLLSPQYADQSFEFGKTYYYSVSVIGNRQQPPAESLPSDPIQVSPRDIFPPGMPKNPIFVVETGAVILMWGAPDDADVAGYRVYRKEQGALERVLLQEALIVGLSYRDTVPQLGKTYEYSIAAVDTHQNEGPPAVVQVEVR